ncbi:S-layer homology domain-containing protein [Bacillus thermotolerans]|uniref:S-layer homology domain-containing protein n=1 Tax=Bacillus thermotolerans TaxID=1221996 RepID=UPI000582DAA2|nr:S-layer homology domain-containing protein [Bacillus thermotolerans]KKB35471.1 hypothetical protein QY97_01649 [Bacillus thermotolerans]
MKGKSWLASLFSIVLLVSSFFAPGAAGAAGAKVDYVALGDSLAAGQTPYRQIDKGYADLIADKLRKNGELGAYTKGFARSGATTADVLATLENADVRKALQQAEVITLSAGANDLFDVMTIDPATSKVTFDQQKIAQAWTALGQNITLSLQELKQLNPQAKIYVMGYYFPFPHFAEGSTKEQAKYLTRYLNGQLETLAKQNGAVFVSVDAFNANGSAYLPNAADVHPNVAGYQVMADAFFTVYDRQATERFIDLPASSEARKAILTLAEAGIVNGKPNGAFEPDRQITRAEAAIILANLRSDLPETAKNPGFKDVAPGMKSYTAIARLTEAGIISKAVRYKPDQPLTRAQMAKLLTLAYELKANGTVSFKDVPADFWAKAEINAVATNGIMIGSEHNTFRPNDSITRKEFAITIYRMLQAQEPAA